MAAGPGSAGAAPAPALAGQAPGKLRAGEFLHSPSSTPSAQFDTESEVPKSIEASPTEVDPLTDLEPMAAAVEDIPEAKPEPQEPLTGWAALQARLTKSAPAPPKEAVAKNELISYEDTVSYAAPAAASEDQKIPTQSQEQPEIEKRFASVIRTPEMADAESFDLAPMAAAPRPKRGKTYLLALVLVSVALVAVPRTRERLRALAGIGARAALRWLNPPPAPLPQTVAQHDSFGQPDDEYKLPATGNIPDSTTDPSQIQVVPVVDPTAKPDKSSLSSGSPAQTSTGAQPPDGEQSAASAGQNAAADQNPPVSTANSQNQVVAAPTVAAPAVSAAINPATAASGNGTASQPTATTTATTVPPPPSSPPQPPTPAAQPAQAQPTSPAPVRNSSPPHVPASEMAGIPSSLKSQIASTTPEMSGAKPEDSATSSIEPVNLPESAVRGLLIRGADPEYPEAAKAGGQQGSVVLQVLIGADGAVQDAKFMQGSFVFARAAIDAVKQWHFKPYSANGRVVSVRSVITLDFKPPA